MAFNVVNVGAFLTPTTADLYTVSTGATFRATVGQLCNTNTSAAVAATVWWVNSSGDSIPLASNHELEANKSGSFVAGGLVLGEGRTIKALASTTGEMAVTIFGEEEV